LAQAHSGFMGRGPPLRFRLWPFGQPMPAGSGQHAHDAWSPDVPATRAPTVASASTAENWNKSRGNAPYTSAITPLYEDWGGEARKGVLTGEANCAVEEDDVDRKICKALAKRPLDGPSSCTRTHRTLGHTLPMGTSEGRTHRRSADGSGEMRCSGRRSGARAAKPWAKAPWALGET
jgi:hypothetical protein